MAEVSLKDALYTDLSEQEKITYQQMLSAFQAKQITIDDLRIYIEQLKDAVSSELSELPTDAASRDRNNVLKGRLRCYILIHQFLMQPLIAKKAFDKAMANVKTTPKN